MNNNKTEKPLILTTTEFETNLIALLNHSALPAFLMTPVLKTALLELQIASEREYAASLEKYKERSRDSDKKETE